MLVRVRTCGVWGGAEVETAPDKNAKASSLSTMSPTRSISSAQDVRECQYACVANEKGSV